MISDDDLYTPSPSSTSDGVKEQDAAGPLPTVSPQVGELSMGTSSSPNSVDVEASSISADDLVIWLKPVSRRRARALCVANQTAEV